LLTANGIIGAHTSSSPLETTKKFIEVSYTTGKNDTPIGAVFQATPLAKPDPVKVNDWEVLKMKIRFAGLNRIKNTTVSVL
jgi:hypothetical protein